MNSKEATLFCLKQYSVDMRGEFVGVTISQIAHRTGFSRQQIHRVMKSLLNSGDVVREEGFQHKFFPGINGLRWNPRTGQTELFMLSE